jgi:hypothetical protein
VHPVMYQVSGAYSVHFSQSPTWQSELLADQVTGLCKLA